jgi:hypothetical protein
MAARRTVIVGQTGSRGTHREEFVYQEKNEPRPVGRRLGSSWSKSNDLTRFRPLNNFQKNLEWLNNYFATKPLPPGGVISVSDRYATDLLRVGQHHRKDKGTGDLRWMIHNTKARPVAGLFYGSLEYTSFISSNVRSPASVVTRAVDWGKSVKSSMTKRTALASDAKRRFRPPNAGLCGDGFRQ